MPDEPADHEVMRNHEFVPILFTHGTEVLDGSPQDDGVLVTLRAWDAVQPGKKAVGVFASAFAGRYRCPIRGEVAGVARDIGEVISDHVSGLDRPRQRTVVNR